MAVDAIVAHPISQVFALFCIGSSCGCGSVLFRAREHRGAEVAQWLIKRRQRTIRVMPSGNAVLRMAEIQLRCLDTVAFADECCPSFSQTAEALRSFDALPPALNTI